MNRLQLVQAISVEPFVDFLHDIGAPTRRILARAGIPDCAFESDEHVLPLRSLMRFAEVAARHEGWQLGFEVGRRTLTSQFGDLGRVILASNSIGAAALAAERYCRLYNPGLRIWLTTDGPYATYHHQYPRVHGDGHQQLDAYTLMLTINQLRQWLGPDWSPVELCVEPAVANGLRHYQDLSACRITRDAGPTRMRVRRELLARPISPREWWIDRRQAVVRLRQSAPPTRLVPSLECLVRTYLPNGAPSADRLATLLDTSVRSLQRRLAEQGTTLSTIIGETRHQRATELIGVQGASVMEAALACGYTDAANFTRAFRRWTGLSPREYRRRRQIN